MKDMLVANCNNCLCLLHKSTSCLAAPMRHNSVWHFLRNSLLNNALLCLSDQAGMLLAKLQEESVLLGQMFFSTCVVVFRSDKVIHKADVSY